jgi:hypothetical protein
VMVVGARPRLRLLPGGLASGGVAEDARGGVASAGDAAPTAAPATSSGPSGPGRSYQLSLPGVVVRPETLVSLGMGDLDFDTFAAWLRRCGARAVLDLRVSASFRGVGFSVARVRQLLDATGVEYTRFPDLANVVEDLRVDPRVLLRRYEVHLEAARRRPLLDDLRSMVRRGPAVVLGWEPEHRGSDREALVDVLRRVYVDSFDLVVLNGDVGREDR